ncbi:MAG: cation:proton antiporter [Acidobacteria bacterium]|nr:cation:proton antiporter [Acidobacteriota bacterium]
METNAVFFRDFAYVFLAALAGGLLAWRLRQPVIIGYVLAGILISPFTPGPSVTDVHSLDIFAEIGVVLLMFSIGLEFSVADLLRTKWVAVIGGPLGILLSVGLAVATGHVLGWPLSQGVVIGATICVASTMVLTRFLIDQGQLHTLPGRIMVAITLVEDLAVVVLIVLIPAFGRGGNQLIAIGEVLGLAAVILIPAFILASKIIPPLLQRVARTQSRELFFIVVLAICLSTAALTQAVGLSLALGAFIAGLMISESEYAHQALAQLFPLRDAFVALFFVAIGLLIDPRVLISNLAVTGSMIGLVIFGKLLVWSAVVRLFGYPTWVAVSVAIGLTQIGEFSFVLVQVARNAGIVGADVYNATLAASLVTILLNAAMVRYIPPLLARRRLARQIAEHSKATVSGAGGLRDHVVLCGFGRVGSSLGAALETFGIQYAVIEIDPDVSSALRNRGIPSVFGDASDSHILSRAGAEKAALVIVGLPDADRSRLAVMNARRMNPTAPIIARAHRRPEYELLSQLGATEVIQPELEASATIIRHAFSRLNIPDEQIRAYLRAFREAMGSLGKVSIVRQPFAETRQITIEEPALAGRSLLEQRIRERFGVTIISITRDSGEELMNPPADTVLRCGDRLRVLGSSEEIENFAAKAERQNGSR